MVTPIYLFRLINATCRDTLIIEETLYEHNDNLQNKQAQNNLHDFFTLFTSFFQGKYRIILEKKLLISLWSMVHINK